MREGEPGSVEKVTVEGDGKRRFKGVLKLVPGAVEVVAHDRMAEGLKVDANLVGTAGLDVDLNQCEGAIR